MDAIDYKILKILQKNARETASNISKEIHLSVDAGSEARSGKVPEGYQCRTDLY